MTQQPHHRAHHGTHNVVTHSLAHALGGSSRATGPWAHRHGGAPARPLARHTRLGRFGTPPSPPLPLPLPTLAQSSHCTHPFGRHACAPARPTPLGHVRVEKTRGGDLLPPPLVPTLAHCPRPHPRHDSHNTRPAQEKGGGEAYPREAAESAMAADFRTRRRTTSDHHGVDERAEAFQSFEDGLADCVSQQGWETT